MNTHGSPLLLRLSQDFRERGGLPSIILVIDWLGNRFVQCAARWPHRARRLVKDDGVHSCTEYCKRIVLDEKECLRWDSCREILWTDSQRRGEMLLFLYRECPSTRPPRAASQCSAATKPPWLRGWFRSREKDCLVSLHGPLGSGLRPSPLGDLRQLPEMQSHPMVPWMVSADSIAGHGCLT